jgi:hypothetical protein
MALFIREHVNLPLWGFRRPEPTKWVPIALSTVFSKLEHPFEVLQFLGGGGR